MFGRGFPRNFLATAGFSEYNHRENTLSFSLPQPFYRRCFNRCDGAGED